MDLTPGKRSKIITLYEHTSLTHREIAEQSQVSLGAVNKIIKIKDETGSISP
jgi:DNA-directed RNA polymerase specialized sigma24 family protein